MNMGDEFFNLLWNQLQTVSDTDRNAAYDLNVDNDKDNYWTTIAVLTGMANYTVTIKMKSGMVVIIHGPREIKYAGGAKELNIQGINRSASINLISAENSTIECHFHMNEGINQKVREGGKS